MSNSISKGGLEVLETSDLDILKLIDHATSILKVDLAEATKEHFNRSDQRTETLNYTFREQWVLKWLLRQLVSEQNQNGEANAVTPPISTGLLFQLPPWMLLLHLLCTVPDCVCADVLAERKFWGCLDRVLDAVLTSSAPTKAEVDKNEHTTSELNGERPKKRRRRTPEQESRKQPNSKTSLAFDLPHIVFHVCCRLADIISSAHDSDHAVGWSWTRAVGVNARCFAASLHLSLNLLGDFSDTTRTEKVLSQLPRLLSFWETRIVAVSDTDKTSEIVAFNSYCLSPCLKILNIQKRQPIEQEHLKILIGRTEKMLALHTVLPLRKSYKEHLSKQWKTARQCLSWENVNPIYHGILDVLLSGQTTSSVDELLRVAPDWKNLAFHLYSIAVRLVLTADHRRKQLDQDWLDALFAALFYLSWPDLPRPTFTAPNTVNSPEIADFTSVEEELEAAANLVQVALDHHTDVPLQTLSYFAASVLSWDSRDSRWALIAKMITLNVNTLVYGLGVPTTEYALDKLRAGILESSDLVEHDYRTLRDGIILPLIRGFGRSRALREFIDFWRVDLPQAMGLESSAPFQDEARRGALVWLDEDVFDLVTEMVEQYATPPLVQDMLASTLKSITELGGDDDSTVLCADVAVGSVVLRARHMSGIGESDLQALQFRALRALEKQGDYANQRWRLWNLIYQIQEQNMLLPLQPDYLFLSDGGGESLSLAGLQPKSEAHRWIPSQLRERLERFALLAQQASRKVAASVKAFRSEILILQSLRGPLLSGGQDVWNGRFADLNDVWKLISACFGVLLSRPALIEIFSELTHALVGGLDSHELRGSDTSAMTPKTTRIDEVVHAMLTSERLDASKKTTSQLYKTIIEGATGLSADSSRQQLANTIPLNSTSKSDLKELAARVFERLSAASNDLSTEHLAAHLTLMDRLSTTAATSFCQADAWLPWVEILRTLEDMESTEDLSSALVVVRSLTSILRKLMASMLDNMDKDGETLRLEVWKWSKAMIKSSSMKYGISRFLALRILMNTLHGQSEKLPQEWSKNATKMHDRYVKRLCSDLIKLPKDASSPDADFQAIIILQALSDLGTMSPPSNEVFETVAELEANLTARPQSVPEHLQTSRNALACLQALCSQALASWAHSGERPSSKTSLEESLKGWERMNELDLQHHIISIARKASLLVESLDSEAHADLLELLGQEDWQQKGGKLVPFVVSAVILQTESIKLSSHSKLVEQLSGIIRLDGVHGLPNSTQVVLALENARLALGHHPKIVNQAIIDALLANISILLSPASSVQKSETPTAAPIFNRICTLLGTLLARFRRRLSDRHHLLLPILQQLLCCLFYPGTDTTKSAFHTRPAQGSNPAALLSTLPPWLTYSSIPLSPSSAETYTRILSSLCNPTPSAAHASTSSYTSSSSTRKNNHAHGSTQYNDPTTRIKLLASSHLQYLLTTYCQATLDGHITSDVKDKLMPGLYCVLEAMGRDVMRGMSASMDAGGKGVFKGLFGDWMRWGRWGGE